MSTHSYSARGSFHGRMSGLDSATLEPRYATLVPLTAYSHREAQKTSLFDNMDDLIEETGAYDEEQDACKAPAFLGKYVIIVNAHGTSDDDCRIEESLQDFITTTSSSSSCGLHLSPTTFSTSRRSSEASTDLPSKPFLNKAKSIYSAAKSKLQHWSTKRKAKDQGSYMSSSSMSSSCHNTGSQAVCVVQTACGPSRSCLVLSQEALQAKAKHWQQAAKAMAGMSRWWKP